MDTIAPPESVIDVGTKRLLGLGIIVGLLYLSVGLVQALLRDGFPPGTPAGVPETMSSTGLVHFAAGALGFLALAVSCFVVARALSRRGSVPLARLSYVAGFLVIVGFLAPAVLPSAATAGIWMSVLVGFGWLGVVAARMRRGVDGPNLA